MKRYRLVVLSFFTWGSVFLARMSVLYLAPFVAPASLRSFRLQVIRRWTRARFDARHPR
jgi:hypothetical protein